LIKLPNITLYIVYIIYIMLNRKYESIPPCAVALYQFSSLKVDSATMLAINRKKRNSDIV